jgi:energy-coupling factor transporter transmembrane protein EcfT
VRTGSGRRTLALASGARSLGSLFVRSTERADRLRLAADLRGAVPGAEPPAAGPGPAGRRDTVAAWAAALVPALLALAARAVLA